MKETSKHLEELNAQFIKVEEKLRDAQDNNETLETKIRESKQKIRSLEVCFVLTAGVLCIYQKNKQQFFIVNIFEQLSNQCSVLCVQP